MKSVILAASDIGSVFLCGHCRNIHLTCGSMTTHLSREAFQELERMVVQAGRSLSATSGKSEWPVAEETTPHLN